MALARLWRLRLPLSLLLLAQLLPAEPWTASRQEEHEEVKDVVCPPGQYVVNRSCETCPNGTYTNQFNSWTKCKLCDQECGINEELVSECSLTSNIQCQCVKGYFKDSNHTEACVLCSSCENDTVLTECSPTRDRVCGSTVPVPVAESRNNLLYLLLLILLMPIPFGCRHRDKLTLWLGQCFKKHPQGTTNEQDGTHRRNSSEMQHDGKDTENDQYNPEERHSLLLGGISDSSPGSTNSVVLELRPLNGTPGTPLPTPVTQEQPSTNIMVEFLYLPDTP